MFKRLFPKKIKLSYGITVCDEATELERLILFLLMHKERRDEILILQDTTRPDAWVARVLDKYEDRLTIRREKLNNDFATFKNTLLDMATGQYLFQIDADELPQVKLVRTLKDVLRQFPEPDCFAVPRINLVKGITPEFVTRWNWKIDAGDRINFPDYQYRIFPLNQTVKWQYKVHEELVGFQNCHYLPDTDEGMCLLHFKDIERQKRQNEFYATFN
ncbi:glycosyltransferase family 2 protein [Spirosoma koreense]